MIFGRPKEPKTDQTEPEVDPKVNPKVSPELRCAILADFWDTLCPEVRITMIF